LTNSQLLVQRDDLKNAFKRATQFQVN